MHPILLLHGALGTKDQFKSLKAELAYSRSVHDLNFRGHGGHACTSGFDMTLFAEDVIAYMDTNQIVHADVFGFSMGGYVALTLAERYPDRIGKITTLGTKFNWTSEFALQETRKLIPEKIEEKVPAFAVGLAAAHGDQWKTVVRKTSEMMAGLPENPVRAKNIAHEVHILLGDKDTMVTPDESRSMADALKRGVFTLLEDVVHPVERVESVKLLPYLSEV